MPVVSVVTVVATKKTPGVSTTPWLFDRPTAIPNDWKIAKRTVR